MSAFWVTCPKCGARYFHLFVGSSLLSGHKCAKAVRR